MTTKRRTNETKGKKKKRLGGHDVCGRDQKKNAAVSLLPSSSLLKQIRSDEQLYISLNACKQGIAKQKRTQENIETKALL